MKRNQIVLPESLHQQAVNLAHSGHQGTTKTTTLLRENVWFQVMTSIMDDTIKNCMQCQVSTPVKTQEPLQMSDRTAGPWSELSADFGQVAPGIYILVVQDNYSRYVVVETLTSLSAKNVIRKLDKILCEFGMAQVIKADNGPPV